MSTAEPRAGRRLGSGDAFWSLYGIAFVATLTVTWGLNWHMMKLAVQEVPPWTFRSFCVVVGGGALLAITWLSGGRVALPVRLVRPLMLVALFNITGWHLFSAYALLHTGSGRAAIIGYTMPIWAAMLSVLVLHERIGPRRIMALALGMAGLAVLLGQDLGQFGAAPIGVLLMLGAAMSWAVGTILMKRFAYDKENRGWELRHIAGGWQLLTRRELHPWVRQLERKEIPNRLSKGALETLAIVAYKQPITRGAIEDIRGVQCGPVLRQLMDVKLVMVSGRDEDALGRPLLYSTTDAFLSRFGLGRIEDLPRRHEFGA
jgi:segregation and condensation protein B